MSRACLDAGGLGGAESRREASLRPKSPPRTARSVHGGAGGTAPRCSSPATSSSDWLQDEMVRRAAVRAPGLFYYYYYYYCCFYYYYYCYYYCH